MEDDGREDLPNGKRELVSPRRKTFHQTVTVLPLEDETSREEGDGQDPVDYGGHTGEQTETSGERGDGENDREYRKTMTLERMFTKKGTAVEKEVRNMVALVWWRH